MKKYVHLEEKVRAASPRHTKFFISVGISSLVVGGFLFYIGVRNIDSSLKISADTNVPAASSTSASSVVLPPVPADPVRDSGQEKTFASGWNMISASILEGYDLQALADAGLILYSFNDPAFPNRNWSTFPTTTATSSKIVPSSPMGYYVFNPGTADKTITFAESATSTKPSDYMFARGWHLLYWPNAVSDRGQFMSTVELVYADGTKQSLEEATAQDKHLASIKIYVVNNEKSADSTSIKELTGQDSDTTISKVPKNSYFWIYLRRTKDRVVDITVTP